MKNKILYVEDEIGLGKVTHDVLVSSGYKVTWIKDGARVPGIFNHNIFDLCIIDIMLPGLDGYSIVSWIRERNPDIPIIFLSARALTEDVVKGFQIGGNDYMRKPFSIEELMARVQNLLSNKPKIDIHNNLSPFEIGDYTFDKLGMQLSFGGNSIKLTHTENELLYRLILHKNEIMNRQKVLLELWENDSFFNARSMDVFITKLRKYLKEDPRISIVNVRGRGYKLLILE